MAVLSANPLAGNLEVEGLVVCHRNDEADVARVVDGEVDDVLRGLPLACALLVQLVGIEGDVLFLGNELVVVVGLHELVVLIVAFNLSRDFLHVGRLINCELNGLIITDIEDIVHPFIEVEISDAVFVGYHGCGAGSFLGISGNNLLRPLCIHGQSREEQAYDGKCFFHNHFFFVNCLSAKLMQNYGTANNSQVIYILLLPFIKLCA